MTTRRDATDPDFSAWLVGHRRRLGLTQDELAIRTGLSVRTVRNWESGTIRSPNAVSLRLMADALGVEISDAVGAALGPDLATPNLLPSLSDEVPVPSAGVQEVADFLATRSGIDVPIAVLSGGAGAGKTSLAIGIGHRLREVFHGGVLFCSLEATGQEPTESAEVLKRFLRVLGVADKEMPLVQAERAAIFRALVSRRRLMVIVDDADSAAQVRPLVPGTPGAAVLVTSRRRLSSLEGARHFEVTRCPVGGPAVFRSVPGSQGSPKAFAACVS